MTEGRFMSALHSTEAFYWTLLLVFSWVRLVSVCRVMNLLYSLVVAWLAHLFEFGREVLALTRLVTMPF